jgi:carbohydrate diacid regulator
MPSRIFQNVIIQMKDSLDRTLGVVDDQGYVIASSELAMIGSRQEDCRSSLFNADTHEIVTPGHVYVQLNSESGPLGYAAFVDGDDSVAKTVCSISAVAFDEALTNYEEKHNRAAFIKNIISDNILPGDVYVRAKELHFVTDELRSVFLIRQTSNSDVAASELVSRLFPDRQHDFVLNINETDIVVVRSNRAETDINELHEVALGVEKALYEQLGIHCVIGISTEAQHLRELADRYKEAQVAIDVGRVFDSDKTIRQADLPASGTLKGKIDMNYL